MSEAPFHRLSKRERQIMDVVFRLGSASVAEIVEGLSESTSYNSVRVTLSILEEKGAVKHVRDGRRFLYSAVQRPERVRSSAVRHLLSTFFQDSAPRVVSTLLDVKSRELSDEELDELAGLIDEARANRRKGSKGPKR